MHGHLPPEVREDPRFRNRDGVALKMHNFSSINPDKPEGGMSHGSQLDQKIWDAWAHRPDELSEVVRAIRASATRQEISGDTGEEEEYEAAEGRLLYRQHRRYERDRGLVARKKKAVLRKTGRLACEVCGFDSQTSRSRLCRRNRRPSRCTASPDRREQDEACGSSPSVSTCHRVIHAHRPFLTPSALRDVRARRSASHRL